MDERIGIGDYVYAPIGTGSEDTTYKPGEVIDTFEQFAAVKLYYQGKFMSKVVEIAKCRKISDSMQDNNTVGRSSYSPERYSSAHCHYQAPCSSNADNSSNVVETFEMKSKAMEMILGHNASNLLRSLRIRGIKDISFWEIENQNMVHCEITAETSESAKEARQLLDVRLFKSKLNPKEAEKFLLNDCKLFKKICETSRTRYTHTKQYENRTEIFFSGSTNDAKKIDLLISLEINPQDQATLEKLRNFEKEQEKFQYRSRRFRNAKFTAEFQVDQQSMDLVIGKFGQNIIDAYKVDGVLDIDIISLTDKKCKIEILADTQEALNDAKSRLHYCTQKVLVSNKLIKMEESARILSRIESSSGLNNIRTGPASCSEIKESELYFQIDFFGKRSATETATYNLKSLLEAMAPIKMSILKDGTVIMDMNRNLVKEMLAVPLDLQDYYAENIRKVESSLKNVLLEYDRHSGSIVISSEAASAADTAKSVLILNFQSARQQQNLLRQYKRLYRQREQESKTKFMEVFRIPSEVVGRVVGKQFSRIDLLKQENPEIVDIVVENDLLDGDFTEIRIYGQTEAAVQNVRSQLDYVVIRLPVEDSLKGRLIGKNGQKLKEISRTANLHYNCIGMESNCIRIIGPREQAEEAKYLLELQMRQHRENDCLI